MLFNSNTFLLAFFPAFLAAMLLNRRLGWNLGAPLATLFSVVFFSVSGIQSVLLLATSITVNYLLGQVLLRNRNNVGALVTGIMFNLAVLGWFKYRVFISANLGITLPSDATSLALPLGISFYTFQKIAFLVDIRRGHIREVTLGKYVAFVLFFPQLIAGPIVKFDQIADQFRRLDRPRIAPDLAVGLTMFTLGLFKKVVIADNIAPLADQVFAAAANGRPLTMVEAWIGALAFSFQIYFDFSAYSDMALGIARTVGIRLPINFFSPYKATSIIEFWRRWHITLSRFLRDYLYIPLGGNRKGPGRRYANLMITMLLGGLWHGSTWGFVLWGGIHGALLGLNHLWRDTTLGCRLGGTWPWRAAAAAATFVSVTVAWVPFRAETLGQAGQVLGAMAGLNGIPLPGSLEAWLPAAPTGLFHFSNELFLPLLQVFGLKGGLVPWLPLAAAAAFLLPNTSQWMRRWHPLFPRAQVEDFRAPRAWDFRPGLLAATAIAAIAAMSLLHMGEAIEFYYWRF